jgi:hypothetical protein
MVELKGRLGHYRTFGGEMRKGLFIVLFFALAATAFGQSRVVVVWDTNAVNGVTINTSVVRIMVDAGIKALTDSTTVGGAWKSCFPGLTRGQNIALKINCINTALPSHPQAARSILHGLTQMQLTGGSFIASHLMAYDDQGEGNITSSGYGVPNDTSGMRVGSNSRWGYQTKVYNLLGASEQFSCALADSCTFLINLCLLKDHYISGLNYTITMKNHYGSVNNPGGVHADGRRQAPLLMRTLRDSLTPTGKEKVYIIDGLFAIYNGGPGGNPQAIPRYIVLSKDPVAIDSMGVEMINNIRAAHGMGPKDSHYLAYAESIGLGHRAYSLIRIINPSAAVAQEPKMEGRTGDFALLPPRPNPFVGTTEIAYLLPRAGEARVEVYNLIGTRVKSLASGAFPAGRNSLTWDGRNEAGHQAASGVYIVRLSYGQASIERTLSLVH